MSDEVIDQDLFLKCLLEANVDGILAFDREFRYTTWNRAMERISGVKREEVLGKCALELEIQEFTQVFTAKDASEARIEARVSLSTGQVRLASRGVTAVEPDAGPEASSGATAMARAAERFMQELAGWISRQAACA